MNGKYLAPVIAVYGLARVAFGDVALRDATVVYADEYLKPGSGEGINLPWGRPAAEDLARIISMTTGGKVKCKGETDWNGGSPDGGNVVFVGPVKGLPFPVAGMGPCEFRVLVKGNRAWIVGPTQTATSYGVTEFIERYCGYRFLVQNGRNPYTVDSSRKAPETDFTMKPAITYRTFYRCWPNGWAKPEDVPATAANWWQFFRQRRLMVRQDDYLPEDRVRRINNSECHLVYEYLPPEKYRKDHPEWYSMDASGRRTSIRNGGCQLCYSNMAMRDEFTKNLLRMIEADRKARPDDYAKIYDMGQGDNCSRICYCPECSKIVAKYNRPEKFPGRKVGGNCWDGGDAGLQLEFANDIVRRVNKVHPDIKLRVFAYVSTGCPPEGIVADRNVVVWWCDVYSRSDNQRGLVDPFNKEHLDEFNGWVATGAQVQVWDYTMWGTDPEVNLAAFRDDLKLFASKGIRYLFQESEYHYQMFYDLHMYVFDKLCFDPEADVDALIREWCRVYGRAADKMAEAIAFIMKLEAENPAANFETWHTRRLPWYTVGNFEKFRALCEEAYALEDNPDMRARVAIALAGVNRWLMTKYRGTFGKEAEAAARQADFVRYEKEWSTIENSDPAKKAKTAAKVDEAFEADNLYFKDMPPGFDKAERGDIRCYDARKGFMGVTTVADSHFEEDGDSETGKCMKLYFRNGRTPPDSVQGGVYDNIQKKVLLTFDFDVPKDGKYRWYKVGTARIGPNSTTVWMHGTWGLQCYFKDAFVSCDGAPVDLNTYESWVSVKRDADGSISVDRHAAKRVVSTQ